MNRHLLGLLLALLWGSTSLFSAESVFDAPISTEKRAALLEICARIAKNEVVRGVFTQTKRISRLKKDFNSDGTFVFSASQGIVWDVQKPQPSTIIITPNKLVQQVPGGAPSVVDGSSNAVFKGFADTMQSVFAGKIVGMERDFSLFFQVNDSGWSIGLVPREEVVRKVIASIEMKGDTFIRSLRIVESKGDHNVYTFKNSQADSSLSNNEQQFFIRAGL